MTDLGSPSPIEAWLQRATPLDSIHDRDEAGMIREQLGPPPPNCCPIYFITVHDGAAERVVYIGKTSAQTQRFRTGHSAMTRLHDPERSGHSHIPRVFAEDDHHRELRPW